MKKVVFVLLFLLVPGVVYALWEELGIQRRWHSRWTRVARMVWFSLIAGVLSLWLMGRDVPDGVDMFGYNLGLLAIGFSVGCLVGSVMAEVDQAEAERRR